MWKVKNSIIIGMYNHAPKDYKCVLCLPAQGIESKDTMMKQADIFYKDRLVMAAVNSKFIETNPGHGRVPHGILTLIV